jgi:hypothetical protein
LCGKFDALPLNRPLLFAQIGGEDLLAQAELPLAMILQRCAGVELCLARIQIGSPGLQPLDQLGRVQVEPIPADPRVIFLASGLPRASG